MVICVYQKMMFLKNQITFAARMLHSLNIALSLSFSSIYCTRDPHKHLKYYSESWIKSLDFPTIPDCWYCWHAAPLHLSLLSKNEQAVAQTEAGSSARAVVHKNIQIHIFCIEFWFRHNRDGASKLSITSAESVLNSWSREAKRCARSTYQAFNIEDY